MPEAIDIIRTTGKELSPADLQDVNEARRREFGFTSLPITPAPDNEEWEKIYFLGKKDGRLVVFGRLHNATVTFGGTAYPVLGVASIVAIEKGRGYGTALTAAMREYVQSTGDTGLGFCPKATAPFYEKLGFGMMPDGQSRFNHATAPRFPGGDAIYISGNDKLIETMLLKPEATAELSRPHW